MLVETEEKLMLIAAQIDLIATSRWWFQRVSQLFSHTFTSAIIYLNGSKNDGNAFRTIVT